MNNGVEIRILEFGVFQIADAGCSSKLIELLLKNNLVDELRLKIHPLTLGKGKKLSNIGAIPASFKLIESSITTRGVIIADYIRAGKVKTGTVGA